MKRVVYQNRNPSHPGIVGDARELGVSHGHLFQVVTGRRLSPNLLRRYLELVSARAVPRTQSPERDLIETTLTKAAEAHAKTDEGEHAFSSPAIAAELAAELAALVTPALRDAVATVGVYLPVRTMVRFTELFTREQTDFIFRINRAPGNRIRLGVVATAPEA